MNVAPIVFVARLTVHENIRHDLRHLINRIKRELVYVELVFSENGSPEPDLEVFIADFLNPEVIQKICDISKQNRPMYVFIHEECKEYEQVRDEVCSLCKGKGMRTPNFNVYRGYSEVYYLFAQWVRGFLPTR